MQQLLAIEWLKIRRYRTFWILAGFFLVMLPLWNIGMYKSMIGIGNGKKGGVNLLSSIYSFPGVWGYMAFWGSVFIMFMSVLVIILVCNEYTFRTSRQNVIDGWSKMQFFHAKIGLIVVLSLLCTVYLFTVGGVFGAVVSGGVTDMFGDIQKVAYFFLLSLNYMGFALFISIWIRRSGLAIGLFFLYSLMIEKMLQGVINYFSDINFGNYFTLLSSDELVPFPALESLSNAVSKSPTIPVMAYIIVSIFWCLVYYFSAKAILQKRDW
jgi:hypothetical protein